MTSSSSTSDLCEMRGMRGPTLPPERVSVCLLVFMALKSALTFHLSDNPVLGAGR